MYVYIYIYQVNPAYTNSAEPESLQSMSRDKTLRSTQIVGALSYFSFCWLLGGHICSCLNASTPIHIATY